MACRTNLLALQTKPSLVSSMVLEADVLLLKRYRTKRYYSPLEIASPPIKVHFKS